jgi:hypothetical protein
MLCWVWASGWNGCKAAADAPPLVSAIAPKPKAAPKTTKLKFFIIVSPFSHHLPRGRFSFRWWFNE